MNTIYNYVESIFVNLPRTREMTQLKEEMLHNMEDKYLDLKAQGVSENEAIGTVLSEFGNIDEILEEYNVAQEEPIDDPDVIVMDNDDVDDYVLHRHKFSFAIAIGVFLCIISVPLLLLSQIILTNIFFNHQAGTFLGVALMLLAIAVAVGIFIISGLREAEYPFAKNILKLDTITYSRMQEEYRHFRQRFSYAIAAGVVMCILGVIMLMLVLMFFGGDDGLLGVVFMMSFIATGVFLFVYYGIQLDTYDKLLSVGSHTPAKVKSNKLTETVSSIVFPLATLYYLYMGFFNNAWGTAWIVFPIVGIGFGIFAAIAEGLMNIKSKR